MKRPPTQIDIAKLVGVSQRVVASVVGSTGAGGPRVSEATRQRILDAANKLGYRPQRQAQLMRGVKSGIIGVIKNISLLQVAIERAYHTSLAIHRAGYGQLVQENIWNDERSMERVIEVLIGSRVEGVLLSGDLSETHLSTLANAGIPIVSIGTRHAKDIPFVAPDHKQAMYDLTLHLLAKGYRRPVLQSLSLPDAPSAALVSPLHWSTQERLSGFLKACKEAGLEEGSIRIVEHHKREAFFDIPDQGFKFAQTAVQERDQPPDLLLCHNDLHATGAQKYLLDQNIDIPHEIGITGYDNTSLGRHLAVPLTTVAHPVAEMANQAVGILLSLIRKERTLSSVPLATLLPCELVLRNSTGAEASHEGQVTHSSSPKETET